MPVDRILTRKHALCEARADDRDRLLILVIERGEIVAGNNGNAERGEKAMFLLPSAFISTTRANLGVVNSNQTLRHDFSILL
jgi:hypothetical protein